MRNRQRITAVFCCWLTILLVSTAAAGERIRLASGEWPPYQSRELKHDGAVSHIVREAFAESGIEVEFGYFPWKRSFYLARTGQWDGTFIWFKTPEREKLFYISEPVIDVVYVFFHKRSLAFDWERIEDLAALRVGATLGYDYGPAFQAAEKNGTIRVVRKPSDGENILRLAEDAIQVFPCDIEVGYELLRQHLTADQVLRFTHHPHPLRAAPHHLLLTRQNPANARRIELFNQGLRQLKSSGKLKRYMDASRQGGYLP